MTNKTLLCKMVMYPYVSEKQSCESKTIGEAIIIRNLTTITTGNLILHGAILIFVVMRKQPEC